RLAWARRSRSCGWTSETPQLLPCPTGSGTCTATPRHRRSRPPAGPRSARPSACSTRSSWPNPVCSRPGSGSRCGCVRRERREVRAERTAEVTDQEGCRHRGAGRRVNCGPGGGPAPGGQARGGARYASNAPRLFASAGEHREALRNDLALQTAEDVAATLGTMKGVLMKLGQMASYVDDGLSPAARRTLSRLQDSVPPMSPELAAQVITEELGQPPERAFATWDPEPIAAASIGQVHRAI